ncbi:MAG TPA: dephospho-CoA kinase [Vicinamibacterales bacterium]|nr:dephospho-CoA kinase [Vicinamibacterales bacterium]
MLRVALTGGIATGKSYVLAKLRDRGVPTIDADDVVHAALGPGTLTTKAIASQFGSVFQKPDGGIDRSLLARKVFGDAESRGQLEGIIHPVVYEAIRAWYETLDGPMGIASVPLLYETRREKDFDFVAVTVCSPEQQLRRILERDRISEEEARLRIAAQMPAEEKAQRGDFVILTGGSMLATNRQVDELLIELGRRTA